MKGYRLALLMIMGIVWVAQIQAADIDPEKRIYLSELTPVRVHQDWGTLGRDASVEGNALNLEGRKYARGLGTHANSEIIYNLQGLEVGSFSSLIGVDKETKGLGSVRFFVYLNGRQVVDSGPMLGTDPPKRILVPLDCPETIYQVFELELRNWEDSPVVEARLEVWADSSTWVIHLGEIPYGISWREVLIPQPKEDTGLEFSLKWGTRRLSQKFLFTKPEWGRAEGEYVALQLRHPHFEILKDPFRWIRRLDVAYEAYEELVGARPYNGRLILILEVDEYPGGAAVAGNPIRWYGKYVPETLRSVNQGNDTFGLLHELGHDFDLDYRWVWHAEFFANFKMVYAAEKMRAKIEQKGRWYDYTDPQGQRLEDYYRWQTEELGETVPLKHWYKHHDASTDMFLRIKDRIGWEPFKKVFRAYQSIPREEIPDDPKEKLNLFVYLLSQAYGQDLSGLFRHYGFPITRQTEARIKQILQK